MRPQGHEGPYDLASIVVRCQNGLLSLEAKIWAEGLPDVVTVKVAIERSAERDPESSLSKQVGELAAEVEDELPPLPVDLPPDLPASDEVQTLAVAKKDSALYALIGLTCFIALFIFGAYQWIKGLENIKISRRPKMDPALHERINEEVAFKGWDQKIFFKEYVSVDLSHLWLVSSSFQTCQVEVSLQSVKERVLSLKDESVAFRAKGELKGHLTEISSFDFQSGTKVVPGLYEMEVRAHECEWDGFPAKLANLFRSADEEYMARMKVVLYHKGAQEFNQVLDGLLKKKMDQELKKKGEEEMFWQDLQQKFQTLLAIGLQIEQMFIDLVELEPRAFKKALAPAVDTYAKKYGHFLTNFVLSNEDFFKDLKGRSQKRNYEAMVRLTSKRIGHASMEIIEDLQKLKEAKSKDLQALVPKIKKTFLGIKKDINEKIIQISEDRVN
jgi:hypothetical protein